MVQCQATELFCKCHSNIPASIKFSKKYSHEIPMKVHIFWKIFSETNWILSWHNGIDRNVSIDTVCWQFKMRQEIAEVVHCKGGSQGISPSPITIWILCNKMGSNLFVDTSVYWWYSFSSQSRHCRSSAWHKEAWYRQVTSLTEMLNYVGSKYRRGFIVWANGWILYNQAHNLYNISQNDVLMGGAIITVKWLNMDKIIYNHIN